MLVHSSCINPVTVTEFVSKFYEFEKIMPLHCVPDVTDSVKNMLLLKIHNFYAIILKF